MRANTRREQRLAFDAVADEYQAARPEIPLPAVRAAVQVARLAPGASVLEIGAGSGQLTAPLRTCGLRVTALEPGTAMRARLRARFATDPQVIVRPELFEAYASGARFAAVAAANAFHWVDPAVAYPRAADLLVPGGALLLFWNYVLLDDAAQTRLNGAVFREEFADFARDRGAFLEAAEASMRDGRAELAASGRFAAPWWQVTTEAQTWSAEAYAALVASYANAAARPAAERARLTAAVTATLRTAGRATVGATNYVYALVARKARPAPE